MMNQRGGVGGYIAVFFVAFILGATVGFPLLIGIWNALTGL